MGGVVQCRLQAGFFVAAQSSVQIELRVKLVPEAILISCLLRTVEIMVFDAKPYHKLRPRLSPLLRIDLMKLVCLSEEDDFGAVASMLVRCAALLILLQSLRPGSCNLAELSVR